MILKTIFLIAFSIAGLSMAQPLPSQDLKATLDWQGEPEQVVVVKPITRIAVLSVRIAQRTERQILPTVEVLRVSDDFVCSVDALKLHSRIGGRGTGAIYLYDLEIKLGLIDVGDECRLRIQDPVSGKTKILVIDTINFQSSTKDP